MAKSNPVNTNPETIKKVFLFQDARKDMSTEDVRILESAKDISLAINNRIGDEVQFVKDQNIELTRIAKETGQEPKLKELPEAVSRNIAVGVDFQSVRGFRSLKDFVSDIFVGSQNKDKMFINNENQPVDVKSIGLTFNKFAQHMVNKVDAFNRSYDNRNEKGRGTNETFTSLVNGKELVEGAGKSVVYQSGSPGGVRLARAVHADAVMVVKAYNATVRAFPESFPEGELSVPELRGFEPQTSLSDKSDPQTDVVKTENKEATDPEASKETDTTAVEEVSSPDGTDEQQKPDLSISTKLTQEEYDTLDDEGVMVSINSREKKVENLPMNEERVGQVMAVLAPFLEKMNIPTSIVRRVTWLNSEYKNHLGQAYYAERVISLKPSVLKRILKDEILDGTHVAFHELMHVIDAIASDVLGDTASMSHAEFDPIFDGEIFNEVKAFSEKDSDAETYFKYALSFSNDPGEIRQLSSELFAEIGAMIALYGAEQVRKDLPKGVAYVERILKQVSGKTKGSSQGDVDGETSSNELSSDQKVSPINERSFDNVNEKFGTNFIPQDKDLAYGNGDELIELVSKEPNSEGFVEFVKANITSVMDRANERLAQMTINKTDTDSVSDKLLAGEDTTLFREFKNTIMADPSTGKYDPDLLSIAVVTVLDWATAARSGNPKSVEDQLKDMGLTFGDVTKKQIEMMLYGLPVRETTQDLAKSIVRMWGMKTSKTAYMSDARGAAEGMAKEILQSLLDTTTLIKIDQVPFFDKKARDLSLSKMSFEERKKYEDSTAEDQSIFDAKFMREQSTIDVRSMKPTQKEIGLVGQGSATKMMAPELNNLPSFGVKIKHVDKTQNRSDIELSEMEQEALKNMQDTPHIQAEFSNMVLSIEYGALSEYLGRTDTSKLVAGHPLRASREGKNLSIERDYNDAIAILDGIEATRADMQMGKDILGETTTIRVGNVNVYYGVGVTRVGRHQMKGINPQNNKILRSMVTPTHARLDMTTQQHKNAFWLTVSQASGISKADMGNHTDILSSIQSKFDLEFGKAVEIALEYLKTGKTDSEALIKAMGGSGDMQQMAAVFAVATLKKAIAEGTEASFDTTLSFELDGKTDGPGNMMVNFGQGLLTKEDYENFKRVGFFLGTKTMTLNEYYGAGKNKDLYEITALDAAVTANSDRKNLDTNERNVFNAVMRFATAFGELKIDPKTGDLEMVRNTAKGPMTKTVYGSSETGIGNGMSMDIVLEMYEQLVKNPDDLQNYPGGQKAFENDFKMLFKTEYPANTNWNNSFLDKKSMKVFTKAVTKSLARVMSESAKNTIGEKITEVNDTLVLLTSFQTEYMVAKFEQLLEEKIAERVKDGSIPLTKAGKPNRTKLTQQDYDDVIAQVREFSPTYSNGSQTLDIGSFGETDSGIRLSSTMDGLMSQPATMRTPELSGVKAIPFITQGNGDAMMMNRAYSGTNVPKKTVTIFDGVDVPIDKIFEYGLILNNAVMENWDADVLGQVVSDFTSFFEKSKDDGEMLMAAWNRAHENAKKKNTTSRAETPEQLISIMYEMHRQNQARKTVFAKIGVSVDHMGGSGVAYTRGPDTELDFGQINNMIEAVLRGQNLSGLQDDDNNGGVIEGSAVDVTPSDVLQITDQSKTEEPTRKAEEGKFSKLVVTDAKGVLEGLLRETRNQAVSAAVRTLMKANLKTRVILGSPEEVSKWYSDNIGPMGDTLKKEKSGLYDPINDVILITDNNHETLTHEMIHAATFKILETFYANLETNTQNDQVIEDSVKRLEGLSKEFMDMDFSKESQETQDAANSAKAQILGLQSQTSAFGKAAALNEFMAWSLSNDALIKKLGSEQSSVFARMSKVVKQLMQRILGGIKSDIFSNILFNTKLLITPKDGEIIGNDSGGNNNNNSGGGLTPAAHKHTGFWIDLARERLQEAHEAVGFNNRQGKLDQFSKYHDNAKSALSKLTQGGFTLDSYQQETFRAIHTVLAMEMRLNTQSALALNKLFKHITDSLKPAMFGPNNAQDRYSAVMELFGGSKNDEGVSDAIAVLLALSQTSAGFRRALNQVPDLPNKSGINRDSTNDFLNSITSMLMSKAVGEIDTDGISMGDALDGLADSILKEDTQNEFRVLSGLVQKVDKADALLTSGMKKLAGYAEDLNNDVHSSNSGTTKKLASGLFANLAGFLDSDRSKLQAKAGKDLSHMGVLLDGAVFLREFITEVVGTDTNNSKLMALLGRTNFAVSAARQKYREEIPVMLQDEFKTHPNETQWKANFNVLGKTDFASLFNLANSNRSFRLISDEAFLDKRIDLAEKAIAAHFSPSVTRTILEKSQQYADYQNGKGGGFQLWRNAYAINWMAGKYTPAMTPEIDKLISMYTLKGTDPEQRIAVTEMYKADPEAMKTLVIYMQALNKEEDLKVISESAELQGFKGFIPNHGQKGTSLVIADDSRRVDLEKRGYVRVGDATADEDFSIINRGYYTTSTKQTGMYSQGVMQTVMESYRGVDAATGLTVDGSTSGVIAGDYVDIVTKELNKTLSVADDKEVLLPVYDKTGVIFYERAINPDMVEKFQNRKENLALMLGAWGGRQVEEKYAQQYNAELILELKRTYDARLPSEDGLFVNLKKEAADLEIYDAASKTQKGRMRKPDRVHVDSWKSISPSTKAMIAEVFGDDNFFVRKDQVNLSLGYRDPSIIDMWTGTTRVPKAVQEGIQAVTSVFMGRNAMKRMQAAEGIVQAAVSTAKDLILIRSLVVPYMNTQANIFQLQSRGVGFKKMLKEYPQILSELEQYNENVKAMFHLDTRIQMAGTDKNRVAILEQQMQVIVGQNARMSIAPLIGAGLYTNLSEGLTDMDIDLTSGRIGDWMEKQTNKLPGGVKTIVKYGLLTKDTAIYKGANKAVQYGDFIAKVIYYDFLIKEKKLDHETAITLVTEEFVNFSALPGRTRSYMEGIGATWFLTFKIRILKIALNQIRENPARALITVGTVGALGSPIHDNIANVAFEDRLGYALGWNQLFGAVNLNPIANIID